MTLATHHVQGSYLSFPSRPLPSRYLTIKRYGVKLHVIPIRSRVSRSFLSVSKCVRISSFKDIAQNDKSSRTHGRKVSSNSMKLSYVPKEGNGNMMGSLKAHDVPVSYTSEASKVASPPAFQKLFWKWLSILRTRPPKPLVDNVSGQVVSPNKWFGSETRIEEKERSPLSKALLAHFWDSSIKLPVMIFISLYLGVHMIYGREVSRELTPLWVIGPLIVALYVKLFRGLWALYTFTFRQTVRVFKGLPAYYLLAHQYVSHGEIKLEAKIRNLDYKEKLVEFQGWLLEKHLDFIESIWPYYCRTVRLLKRANII